MGKRREKFKALSTLEKQRVIWKWALFLGIFILIIVVLELIKIVPYETYRDETFGFEIKYPAIWSVLDRPQGQETVVFITPKQHTMDTFYESVNITFVDLSSKPMTQRQFNNITIDQMQSLFGEYITILESQPITISGRQGYKFMYVAKNVETPIQNLHVWVIAGNKAYIITYMAAASEFKKFRSKVNAMIRSFKILRF